MIQRTSSEADLVDIIPNFISFTNLQGKLQLWIDIFPASDLPPPPKVDIKIRKPVRYELRVIIWNTDEVVLDEDDFYSGDKKCDIYVKG